MSIADWLIVTVFIVSFLIGLLRGFVKESLSIISWVLAIWFAQMYAEDVSLWINQYYEIPVSVFRHASGFIMVFIVSLFTLFIISYLITKIIANHSVHGVDRILGGGVGLIRAAAIVVIVLMLARGFGMGQNAWWNNSKYIAYFEPSFRHVERFLPPEWRVKAEPTSTTES